MEKKIKNLIKNDFRERKIYIEGKEKSRKRAGGRGGMIPCSRMENKKRVRKKRKFKVTRNDEISRKYVRIILKKCDTYKHKH